MMLIVDRYSLLNPHHRVRSELVEPYLVPPMGNKDFNGQLMHAV